MTALPNLLIIGAQKCGTTWLHQQLSRHPDIFMARAKELHFFTKPAKKRKIDEYAAHFAEAAGHKFVGESTPGYFWTYEKDSPYCRINPQLMNTNIPESVLQLLGKDVKLIVLLRNPVHRAVSAYLHHYRMGRLQYDESLLEIGARSGIIDMGFYKRHLQRWEACFGVGSILVLFFDDLVKDGAGVLGSTFTYLGLPTVDIPDADRRVHAGFDLVIRKQSLRISKDELHTRTLLAKKDLLSAPHPRIKLDDLVELHKIYSDDIAYIEDRFASANLNWSDAPRLEDFVHTPTADVSPSDGERNVPVEVASAPSAELYKQGMVMQANERMNHDDESIDPRMANGSEKLAGARVADSLRGKTLVLGIGAQRCGTTWLHNYLSRSPEIYCAGIKEMHFFDTLQSGPLRKKYKEKFAALLRRATSEFNCLNDVGMEGELKDRCRMFNEPSRYWEFFARRVGDKRFFCDVTPSYGNIGVEGFRFVKDFAGEAGVNLKLFFVMRDPIERSRSAIALKHGRHHGSVVSELAKAQFVSRARYDLIIENARQVFSETELLVLFYEHVFSDPDVHLKRLMDFLGIPYHRPDTDWRPSKARATAPLDPAELKAGFGAFEPTYAYVSREFPDKPQTWYY